MHNGRQLPVRARLRVCLEQICASCLNRRQKLCSTRVFLETTRQVKPLDAHAMHKQSRIKTPQQYNTAPEERSHLLTFHRNVTPNPNITRMHLNVLRCRERTLSDCAVTAFGKQIELVAFAAYPISQCARRQRLLLTDWFVSFVVELDPNAVSYSGVGKPDWVGYGVGGNASVMVVNYTSIGLESDSVLDDTERCKFWQGQSAVVRN